MEFIFFCHKIKDRNKIKNPKNIKNNKFKNKREENKIF